MSILYGFNEQKLRQLISNQVSENHAREYDSLFAKQSSLKEFQLTPYSINQYPIVTSTENNEVACIAGIHLPVLKTTSNINVPLVEVPSTLNNLRKIALGLITNRAICLLGAVGSGKTSLVEYLAQKTGRNLGENFVKVQLGDQTDSKMLLGTYKCTDIPGEFVWQPGVLTQVKTFCILSLILNQILVIVTFILITFCTYYTICFISGHH